MIGIKHIVTHFEGKQTRLSNLTEYQLLPGDQKEYFDNTGIEFFYTADDATAFDLAEKASRKLLKESGLQGGEIDLIIFIRSRLPETLIASEAARLQYCLDAKKAQVFTISDLGCTDMSMALKLAFDFLTANFNAQHVLIAHGCKPFSSNRLRYPVTLTADGGIALLLARTETNQLIDFKLETEGRYWNLFQMKYTDRTFEDYAEECTDLRMYGFELALESKMRFLDINKSLLTENNLKKEDISHYILQNISERAFEFYETAFEVEVSPVCRHNLSCHGHLGPNDVMLNYLTGLQNGLFQEGELVLIMNNSPIAAWSSLLLKC